MPSRRPGMMSTPNLLVLTSHVPDGVKPPETTAAGGGGGGRGIKLAAQMSLHNPKSLAMLSPIASNATSPNDSPMGDIDGVAGGGFAGSTKPASAVGLRVSPPKPRAGPGHTRNQHSWGGVGSGVGGSSAGNSMTTAAGGMGIQHLGGSKSTSPTKRVTGTGTGGAGGLPRPPSWQEQLTAAKEGGGGGGRNLGGKTFDNFDSWV